MKPRKAHNSRRELGALRLVRVLELAAPGMVTYRLITAALNQRESTTRANAHYARLLGYDVRSVRGHGLRINKWCLAPETRVRKRSGEPEVSPTKFREETPHG